MEGGVLGFRVDADLFTSVGFYLLDEINDFFERGNFIQVIKHLRPFALGHNRPNGLDFCQSEVGSKKAFFGYPIDHFGRLAASKLCQILNVGSVNHVWLVPRD